MRVDLRVDDSRTALSDLRRLYRQHVVQQAANDAFEVASGGRVAEGLEMFEEMRGAGADDPDVALRHAIVLAAAGQVAEARACLSTCYSYGDGWRELVRRLSSAGLLPNDDSALAMLLA
jgi:hypothetical protein